MPPAQAGPSPALLVALLAVIVIAVVVYLRRRRNGRVPGRAAASSAAGDRGAWAPPSYAASASRPSGPLLTVGINLVQVEGDHLLVSWNAVNAGTVPVQIRWGAPAPVRGRSGELRLLYAQSDSSQPGDVEVAEPEFEPPATRLAQPGEIISRTASLAPTAIGRALSGLQVAVAVGYGPADTYPSPPVTREAYLGWEQVAVSQVRIVR